MSISDMTDAQAALASMLCLVEDFSEDSIRNALVTAIVAVRTGNDQHGLIRLEQVRDSVAVTAAKLADEVILLDTAINNIKAQRGEEECSTTTQPKG